MSTRAAGDECGPLRVALVGVRRLVPDDFLPYVLPPSVVEVVGDADDLVGAIDLVERTRPDVILVTASSEPLSINDMMKRRPFAGRPKDQLSLGRSLLERWPSARIIVVSDHGDFELGEYARRSGFRGCIAIEPLADVQRAIVAVAKGEQFFPEKGFLV
jgi:DNA-binding NarL/FixJ family response regulator